MDGKDQMPAAGVPEAVAPGVRRVLAPNPGPMTFWGTNSYLVGEDPVTVIDPGPSGAHCTALLDAIGGAKVTAILVTHAHLDHSGGAADLAEATGAEVWAFGPPGAGRSAHMARFASEGALGGGEGVDQAFRPDTALTDGQELEGSGLTALHMPGHFPGHLCFGLGELVFSGDLVVGWSTTLISPPDGDVAAFMASCRRLRSMAPRRLLPGHGPPVEDPVTRIDALIAHREMREQEIVGALADGPSTASDLAARIYRDLDPGLKSAATRNVLAHLIDLSERGEAKAEPDLSVGARWHLP
ncbi:MAG: MBL fold metallo-hydrolase [Pseudomonadota bacterium]